MEAIGSGLLSFTRVALGCEGPSLPHSRCHLGDFVPDCQAPG